jgi:hypothetical protein
VAYEQLFPHIRRQSLAPMHWHSYGVLVFPYMVQHVLTVIRS